VTQAQAPDVAQQSVTLEDVLAAAERIGDLAAVTPVLKSHLFNQRAGRQVRFKCENLQRGGSFKIRGALNFIAQLSEAERGRGVVAFSSGNHAQAVACAAAHLNVAATIVMPSDAPRAKLESTRAFGPKIVFYNRLRDDREAIAMRLAEETGATLLPPFDHPWIIAGQGTVALEFLRQCPELNLLAVPLGGGGLLAGTLIVARALRPGVTVVGVEPELADDWSQSLAAGKRIRIAPPATIADGLRTPEPGRITYQLVQQLGGVSTLVSEAQIAEALRFLLTRLKMLVEPSGAVAAAAALFNKLPACEGETGVILSGGNIDLDVLAKLCAAAA
jgi:threonine dehydratase